MPAAKKPAAKKAVAKSPAKKTTPRKADEPEVESNKAVPQEKVPPAREPLELEKSVEKPEPVPTSAEDRVDAPLERLADSEVVQVKNGKLTVDLAAIANSPQMEREARGAEIRKLLERFQQDPFGVIG